MNKKINRRSFVATTGIGALASPTLLAAAVCPIVYPVDQSPSDRGYHYIFYGNGFFVNEEGYLITAAHVLSQLRDSQPYILLQLPMAPPRLVKATVVLMDQEHDVAVLRATPNPFGGRYRVSFLPLATDRPEQAHAVLAEALRPSRLKNPYTFDALVEDRPAGEVLEYRFTQFDKGLDTEIFLFSHDVLLGDSGAPVVSAETLEVVGLVEGRWLHGAGVAHGNALQKQSAVVGAVVPIHYAIALLAQKGIAWGKVSDSSARIKPQVSQARESSLPLPLSLVAAPYPSDVFSGGEVVLNAAVETTGRLGDIRILRGENPFLEKVLTAVHTWTFQPARSAEKVLETRIGIIFQFAGSLATPERQSHTDAERLDDAPERGVQPLVFPAPDFTSTKLAEGSVILCEEVAANGQVDSIAILGGPQPLIPPTVAAAHQWRFTPARQSGADSNSEVVVVVIFRRLAAPVQPRITKATR